MTTSLTSTGATVIGSAVVAAASMMVAHFCSKLGSCNYWAFQLAALK